MLTVEAPAPRRVARSAGTIPKRMPVSATTPAVKRRTVPLTAI
jgi:hypothetical protein